jgi:hypothetical protein
MSLTIFREGGSSWIEGGATGANIVDANDTSNNTGNGLGGGTNGLYASGAAGGGSGLRTLVVSGTPWTPNQWVGNGYMVTNLDQVDSKGFNVCSLVISNTSNTITFRLNNQSGTDINFASGNRYEIRKVLVALDQPGRGGGDACVGDRTATFHNTVATGWPHEVLEPWYCWNNSINGTMNDSRASLGGDPYPTLAENRDYYNFNSLWAPGSPLTSGIASGTLVNRPTACTAGIDLATGTYGNGVAYWATDTNTLYVCSSPNTWKTYYTPYQYPHPLVSGVPAPPTAPTNLHVK